MSCAACNGYRWFDDRGFPCSGQPFFSCDPCSDCNPGGHRKLWGHEPGDPNYDGTPQTSVEERDATPFVVDPSPGKSLAQEAYEAWDREAREHVGAMPPWDGLPNGIKNAWNAALERAFEVVMTCPKDGVKLRNIEISVENPPSSSEDPDRVETVVNMKIAFASPAEAITISIPIRTLVSPVTFTFPGEDGVDAERAAIPLELQDLRAPTLERDLESVLNRYSAENGSNTPDFLLAEYLMGCLAAWNKGVIARDKWYAVRLRPGDSYFERDALESEQNEILVPVPPGYSVWRVPIQVLARDGLSTLHPYFAYEASWGEHYYSSELAAIDACRDHAATKDK